MTATLSRRDRPSVGAQDLATRRWVKQAWNANGSLTRVELLTYAQQRIAELTAVDAPGRSIGWKPVHSAVANFVMSMLTIIVDDDDLATPQVAPTPDGGLDVQWLVSGGALEVVVDLQDGVSIVGRLDNGEYAFQPFDWEFGADVKVLRPALAAATAFLEKISTGIQHRVQIR